MPITLENSNGEDAKVWPKSTVTEEELTKYFPGATGALCLADNSPLFPDGNKMYHLEDGKKYKVMVPPKGNLNATQTFSSSPH